MELFINYIIQSISYKENHILGYSTLLHTGRKMSLYMYMYKQKHLCNSSYRFNVHSDCNSQIKKKLHSLEHVLYFDINWFSYTTLSFLILNYISFYLSFGTVWAFFKCLFYILFVLLCLKLNVNINNKFIHWF